MRRWLLPDDSTGPGPGTLASKLSRCKAHLRQGFGVRRRVWRGFCRPGTNFIEHYACRGTSLIGASKLSRYRIYVRGTGAVSRYNLSRSQKTVTVQDLFCGKVRVSWGKNHYKQLTHIVRVMGFAIFKFN
jgi:hypothetical protein